MLPHPPTCDRTYVFMKRRRPEPKEVNIPMNRRNFLRTGSALAAVAGIGAEPARGIIPAHNWGNYDFGAGPQVSDRLNQGPFPQYPPEVIIPGGEVVMTTTPSDEVVPGYGKGLVTYITADMGTAEIQSGNTSQAIEELIRFPLGQKLYQIGRAHV